MKGLEITGENLEDLLAYDDLFLDYFNAFLALPAFPQPLVYNRLTGAFEEVDEEIPDMTCNFPALNPATLHYGPTDAEREKMLEWARQHRLPIFLKTQLFRELKLVKQLLRRLEDRSCFSRGSSRNLRGYSRQTETCVSSLDNSTDNISHSHHRFRGLHRSDDSGEEFWMDLNYPALYRYQRPGSCALSMPIKMVHDDMSFVDEEEGYFTVTTGTNSSKNYSRQGITRQEPPAKPISASGKRGARISNNIEVIPPTSFKSEKTRSSLRTKGPPASSTEEAFKKAARALSAPVSQSEFLDMPPLELPDFDVMFGEEEPEPTGQAYVTFEDDHISEEQTETDVRNMEGRFQMSLQQMKEHILCSRSGFEQFREFLKDTSGRVLLDFWLDCENFKDTMEDFDDNKQGEIASMLFRDIQDKYKLKLTQDAKEQITRSTSNIGLSHTIFLRTQYDVLRRLRAYWLPRYLLHCERTNTFDVESRQPKSPTPPPKEIKPLRSSRIQPSLFPTISLVHSMPVLPEEARNFSFSQTVGSEYHGLRRATSSMSLRSARSVRSNIHNWMRRSLTSATIRSTKERFLFSLAQDRIAGGPFQRYLSKLVHDGELLSSLLFWQDVTEYGATEDRSADRLLRLCHAWTIYTKFLSDDSPHKIGILDKERLNLHKTLQSASDFIEASIFDTAKTFAVSKLEKAWIRFLKEDLKAFLDCRVRIGGDSPPSTAEAIEITVTDQDVLIKRPRPWVRRLQESTTERGRRLQKALQLAEDIDDERRAQKKLEALERRKAMERERRKAVRTAYARQKEAQKKKVSQAAAAAKRNAAAAAAAKEASGAEGPPVLEPKEEEKEKTGTNYVDLAANKQVMAMFRKYLNQHESVRDVQNSVQMYQDIDSYFNIKDTSKVKKDTLATHIFKTYLDPQSKKYTETNEQIVQRVSTENERPKTATLKEIHGYILPKLEETFAAFLAHRSKEMGVSAQELANMSQAELSMRTDTDTTLYTNWQKAGFKGQSRGKPTGRSQPSREDKNEFLHVLGQSAAGQPTVLMLYFYKYLLKHGEDDGMPLLDKDLFFYIEVQKFKDCSHAYADEEMMKRKVQSVVDCFLDSVYSPSLQIDVSSEIHTKTMKASQRYLTGKEVVPSLFDEAQYYVFKELLPYWAGFRKSQHFPDDLKKRPVTKHDKMMQKRLDTIQNYQIPAKEIHLPRIPEGGVASYTITLSDGVKCREVSESPAPTPVPEPKEHRGSRMTIGASMESLAIHKRGRRTSTVLKDPLVSR